MKTIHVDMVVEVEDERMHSTIIAGIYESNAFGPNANIVDLTVIDVADDRD